MNGINIVLPFTESFTIAGHVARSTSDARIQSAFVSSPAKSVRQFDIMDDGSFSLSRVKPGRYMLWARAQTADGFEASWQALDVFSDMSGIQLPMTPAGRISGRVVTDTGSTLPAEGLRVAAILTDGTDEVDPLARDQVEVEADGRFVIDGLFGDRTIRVIELPSGWALTRAARQSARDRTHDGFRRPARQSAAGYHAAVARPGVTRARAHKRTIR